MPGTTRPSGGAAIDPAIVASCVHCGFCLPACPTYRLTGEEPESPRGRIVLIGGLANGAVSPDAGAHIDHCLGCYACVSACPTGVRYDLLLEGARAELEAAELRSAKARAERWAIFALFPHRRRIRVAARLLALAETTGMLSLLRRAGDRLPLPGLARAAVALTPERRAVPEPAPTTTPLRGRVGLLRGCVQDAFFPEINGAARVVLAAEGYAVADPDAQGCCGALSEHAGRHDEAVAMARRVVDAFEHSGIDALLVSAAGCGSVVKHYDRLLADDPAYAARAKTLAAKTYDVCEFLATIEPRAPRRAVEARIAYHDACHLAHGQGVRGEPRRLLAAIPGVELLELGDGERCCGSAGVYNLLERQTATTLGDEKAQTVLATGAEVVVSGNPGCNLQLSAALARAGSDLRVRHTLEVLATSVAGKEREELLESPPRRGRRGRARAVR